MHEATGTRLRTAVRVALLSLFVATAWLILSFATTSTSAVASSASNTTQTGLFGNGSDEPGSALGDLIKTVTKPVSPIVDPVLAAVLDPVVDIATTPVVAVGTTISTTVSTTPVSTVVEGVANTITDLTTTVSGSVSDLVEGTPLAGVVGQLTTTIDGASEAITDNVVYLVNGVGSGIDDVVNGVVGQVIGDVVDIIDPEHTVCNAADAVVDAREALASTPGTAYAEASLAGRHNGLEAATGQFLALGTPGKPVAPPRTGSERLWSSDERGLPEWRGHGIRSATRSELGCDQHRAG